MAAAAVFFILGAASADTPATEPVRFVSLKAPGTPGRHGPGDNHRIDWIYQRPGLPLQVTDERGRWLRVVDPDGAAVWMLAENLDARRMTYVLEETTLRRSARADARPLAYLDEGVIGALTGCEGEWRRVAVGGRVGWVAAGALWGADCAGL